jgi:two-component system phosphate regulon sensor histidine kinase PhoR
VPSNLRPLSLTLIIYVVGLAAIAAAVVLYTGETLGDLETGGALDPAVFQSRRRILAAILVGFVLVGSAALWIVAATNRRFSQRLAEVSDLSSALVGRQASATAGDVVDRLESNLLSLAESLKTQLRQARTEQHKLEAVLSGMVEGLLVIDREGTVQLANERAQQLFATTSREPLVGRPLVTLSRDPDLQELVREVTHAKTAGPMVRELRFRTGGRAEILQVNAVPIAGSEDVPELSILVFHDVTELKRLESTRRDFVANVSHELRTPLTAVRGYAETLQSGALDDPSLARKFLRVIERHSERLTRLTDDLLTLSDLELGRTALQRAPMPLTASVDAAIDVVRDKAGQSKITLRSNVPADLFLWADADRLEQVLVNLIDNAVKYSTSGARVTVSARTVEGTSDLPAAGRLAEHDVHRWVEIVVADTGVGIPSQDLPRLTERFYRVDRARSRELGGTGLGLAIFKHIVQAHDGVLHIESELGRGTKVYVYLPADPQAREEVAA